MQVRLRSLRTPAGEAGVVTDWARRHEWWADAARLYLGLITRGEATKRGVPHMTVPPYAAELKTLEMFSLWVHWYNTGRHNGRPDFELPVPRWAWVVENEWHRVHRQPKPEPAPDPEHQPEPKPAPSWTLPSPLVMSGVVGDLDFVTDPNTGKPRAGIGTVGRIAASSVCPLWECRPVNGQGRGWLGQIEGQDQLQAALDQITERRQPGDHLAIVGTGNVKADRMIEAGVNVAFYELNAQAGWEPYGNTDKILFQGHQDGWPYVYPSYGVYVPVSLQEYAAYHPQVTDDGGKTWTTSPTPQGLAPYYAVFSGQGMSDTDSWGALGG